jgi:hypothetical protein
MYFLCQTAKSVLYQFNSCIKRMDIVSLSKKNANPIRKSYLGNHGGSPGYSHCKSQSDKVVRSIPYIGSAAIGHDQSGSSLGSEFAGQPGPGSADTGIERSAITSPHLFDVDLTKLNFSDIAIHIFKPSEVKFTTKGENPQSETFLMYELRQMYYVKNKESMADFIAKLIYMAKLNDQNKPKPAPVGTSLVPTSSSEGARYTYLGSQELENLQPKPDPSA